MSQDSNTQDNNVDASIEITPEMQAFYPVSYTHLTLPTNREV